MYDLIIDQYAIAAIEIFHLRCVFTQRDAHMVSRNRGIIEPQLAIETTPHDRIARR